MSLPDLSSLSLQQLQELMEDEEKLNKMAEVVEEVQNIQPNKDMSLANNRTLAEQNLQYHPKLDCLKLQLTRKYQELQTQFEAYQMRKSRLDFHSPPLVERWVICFQIVNPVVLPWTYFLHSCKQKEQKLKRKLRSWQRTFWMVKYPWMCSLTSIRINGNLHISGG
uniref:vacuolar protein sorting-associated protein 37B-like isoform X2 n=1 Tax=Pristiophorus japonicus TaxID=55135 RepID=UPI00398E35F4